MAEVRGLPAGLADLQRTLVMGVLNVTPDSFSDGGRFMEAEAAIAHGRDQIARGADLIDVGGESTRPGARRIRVEEELDRILPVIEGLVAAGVPVSVDTMRAEVARAAVDAGAVLINDVSGGLADPQMIELLGELQVPYVVMHWRGHSADMDQLARYTDVVADVRAELAARLDALARGGIDPARVVLDPGLGFAKTQAHNWELLRGLDQLASLGRPLLIGASRKRFLGQLLADEGGPRPPAERDRATDAITALAAARGVWGVRVHEAAGSRDAIAVAGAWPTLDLARESGPVLINGSFETGPDPGSADANGARFEERARAAAPGDRIILTGVRARGHHGVLDFERAQGQEFVVDVTLDVGSVRPAAAMDDLSRTVDYGEVAEALVQVVEGPPVDLIETLAEALAARCLRVPGVREVELTLHKPQAPITVPFQDVAVRIVRHA